MSDIGGAARRVPGWAAGLVAVMSRDRPAVVTLGDIASYLASLGSDRDPRRTAFDLQRLGWLGSLHLKGVWTFVPAGEAAVFDPYIDLRAWQAHRPADVFALAGEASAWHLGYLPRAFIGTTAVWLPAGERVPHGLRRRVSQVRISWPIGRVRELAASPRLLHRKGLDITGWAGGLPALGPEALLVQLGARPSSFRVWADLIPRLDVLASDCDIDKLKSLLNGNSASAWQRSAYLLHRGGRDTSAADVLACLPGAARPVAALGDGPSVVWSSQFRVNDRLVAPLQRQLGKA